MTGDIMSIGLMNKEFLDIWSNYDSEYEDDELYSAKPKSVYHRANA